MQTRTDLYLHVTPPKIVCINPPLHVKFICAGLHNVKIRKLKIQQGTSIELPSLNLHGKPHLIKPNCYGKFSRQPFRCQFSNLIIT